VLFGLDHHCWCRSALSLISTGWVAISVSVREQLFRVTQPGRHSPVGAMSTSWERGERARWHGLCKSMVLQLLLILRWCAVKQYLLTHSLSCCKYQCVWGRTLSTFNYILFYWHSFLFNSRSVFPSFSEQISNVSTGHICLIQANPENE